MDHRERNWLFVLIGVFLVFNAITLSPLVPWQKWMFWSKPTPDRTIAVAFGDYEIRLPTEGIEVQVGEYVEFVATSDDVTYGLGVFRKDGSLVFQEQVLPGRENRIVWQFNAAGLYDVRSTEYSGPRHSEMYIPDAIRVTQ
jgi:cytochrome c oxidase subunit 2